ncbi:hypothetical protein M0Q39_00165 [Patescibacteria group bacterium]|nr:hypothetical protein [Patescibacteria group bacterium]
MSKKNTITLSKSELKILEDLVLDYGSVVDFNMISKKIGKNKNKQEIKNIIGKLVKKGWLVRIKRGLFAVSDIYSRGSVTFSQQTIAQIIDVNSYVSFEGALQYYGMFDQYLKTITSIGLKRAYYKKFSNWVFRYIKSKKELFGDFKEYNIDGRLVKIAIREKAILDFLEYRRSFYSVDLVIERLKDYKNDIDMKKLISISKKYSLTSKRVLGFILDFLNYNSDDLYNEIKKNKNHSFMTSKSKNFNAKWRLYVDDYFVNK